MKQSSPSGNHSMGFSAFNSLSGGPNFLSIYFPFSSGLKPPASSDIRTSAVQSPLWKLPSRMLLSFNVVDEVDARLEWLGDAATAREHKTATWVMRDRYLSQKINMADPNWAVAAAPGLLVNALKYRLNSPFEGSGSLWWRGMPEVVTPLVQGLAYTLFTPSMPIFSASSENWNSRGHTSVANVEPPPASKDTRADYIIVQPKFENEPKKYLSALPGGLDSLANYGPA